MIAKIRGKIDFICDSFVVVDVHGIGYKVFLTAHTLGVVAGKEEIEIYTHTYVREDTLALYGFLEFDELLMFELLISISGIGPKAAMGILSIANPAAIRTAVLNEDSSILTRVSGVGKKIAQRVILELKNKVGDLPTSQKERATADSEVLEALMALGYSASQARDAMQNIPSDAEDIGQRVKFALKHMGTGK